MRHRRNGPEFHRRQPGCIDKVRQNAGTTLANRSSVAASREQRCTEAAVGSVIGYALPRAATDVDDEWSRRKIEKAGARSARTHGCRYVEWFIQRYERVAAVV